MFGISNPDLLVILLLILLLFGPKKIPEMMRVVGGVVRELRRASLEASSEFHRFTTAEPELPSPATPGPGASDTIGEKPA